MNNELELQIKLQEQGSNIMKKSINGSRRSNREKDANEHLKIEENNNMDNILLYNQYN